MKLALVTGGLRRIGAVIAARLASEGYALALHCRKPTEPQSDLAAILATTGCDWHAFAADFADDAAAERTIADVIARFGRAPDLLVNNASHFSDDHWHDLTAPVLTQRMAINFTAPVMLTLALARSLGPGQTACVVNILDQRIRQPNGDQLSYTFSKQALAAATETLARALAPQIRVNAVAPGLTLPTDDYLPAQMVALEQAMPLGLLPEPDDIADAILWLADARATTGQTVFVDGGAALTSFERDFIHLEGQDAPAAREGRGQDSA